MALQVSETVFFLCICVRGNIPTKFNFLIKKEEKKAAVQIPDQTSPPKRSMKKNISATSPSRFLKKSLKNLSFRDVFKLIYKLKTHNTSGVRS